MHVIYYAYLDCSDPTVIVSMSVMCLLTLAIILAPATIWWQPDKSPCV